MTSDSFVLIVNIPRHLAVYPSGLLLTERGFREKVARRTKGEREDDWKRSVCVAWSSNQCLN